MRAAALLALALLPGVTWAQKTALVEVRFTDGSTLRMALLHEHLEVQTKYGKLTIPVEDIRKIEVGLHLTPEEQQSVTSAVKGLGSTVYKERENASRNLLQLGHLALPALREAAQAGDPECMERASGLVRDITAQVPDELANLREDDVITADMQVIGRILSPNLKARSLHFGPVDVKLGLVRSIRIRRDCTSTIVLDAAKIGTNLDRWHDTGMSVDARQPFVIHATGQVDLWPQQPGQYLATPKGFQTIGKGGQFQAAALIAKVGEHGKPFNVGEQYQGTAPEEGRLYLLIVPSPWNNASTGRYSVRIQTGTGAIASNLKQK
ncbi:MAG TPA: hypothetical protein VFE62_02735 [Gemmataceae bacterium]|nr:hypothetical protein [Gemmataceae bacterium]